MDNLEDNLDIKEIWNHFNVRIADLEEENRQLARRVVGFKYKNCQEKLIKKYIGFICVEIIMIFYLFLIIGWNPYVNESFRWITLGYMVGFFMFEASLDFYLMQRVKSIDVYNSSVSEIAKLAAGNWKIHNIGILIGLPLAIIACVLFGFTINANKVVILGMVVGGIVGLAIGVREWFKFLKYYKALQGKD